MKPIAVMQVCDTLAAGGQERVALNIANLLPCERYHSHLCTTRADGPLAEAVAPGVGRLCLHRAGRFDPRAVRRLVEYIRAQDVRILHAHGTSLFFAVLAAAFPPRPLVLWHDHFGRQLTEDRPAWLYRLAAQRTAGVLAVSESLADWARQQLRMPADRVWYIPNFVCVPPADLPALALPGTPGYRIVCVANLRPEKDHLNLLAAMKIVVAQVPAAQLILVGNGTEPGYRDRLQRLMQEDCLAGHVTWLGPRNDVPAVLNECDVGVLSSASEGMPLALIEYGMAGLPVVATRVGQCAEVLDYGGAGLLVPAAAPDQLGEALVRLLRELELRATLGRQLQARVFRHYSANAVLHEIETAYETILPQLSCKN